MAGPAGLTAAGGGAIFVAAGHSTATDSQIDLFVDNFGAVNVMWVVDGGVWQGPQALTAAGIATIRASIATAPQSHDQIDIFFIDTSGGLNVMWVIDGGVWQGPATFSPNRFAAGSLIHELGHAIGLHHEHQRPDSGEIGQHHRWQLPNYGAVMIKRLSRTIPLRILSCIMGPA